MHPLLPIEFNPSFITSSSARTDDPDVNPTAISVNAVSHSQLARMHFFSLSPNSTIPTLLLSSLHLYTPAGGAPTPNPLLSSACSPTVYNDRASPRSGK